MSSRPSHRPGRPPRLASAWLLGVLLALSGCDQLGIESASSMAARRDAEGKAVGGACRHAARSIEQCYALNKKADKAAVFNGWREMNDYMRENKLDAMPEAAEAAASAPEGEKAEALSPAAPAAPAAPARRTAAKAAAPNKDS